VVRTFILIALLVFLSGCVLITAPYEVTKGAVKGTVFAVKTTYVVASGTTKVVYKVGKYTYEVVKAPLDWTLTHPGIETIDGLPVKEAIRLGRIKTSPYTVNGIHYAPMSLDKAGSYSEVGTASWYGYETRNRKGGYMTADGEAFDPEGLTAAHKYLPLPYYVEVTNLENNRSIIVRVNDRGPFPCSENPAAGNRIIDLSLGAAKRLDIEKKGTALVKVEAVKVVEED
jgi:rare lipoprotein A